jgi:hypothetical protein
VPFVLKSGSLNLLQPSGPVQACNGIVLPYIAMVTDILVAMVTTVTDVPVVSFVAMVTNGTNFHRRYVYPKAPKVFRSTDTSYAFDVSLTMHLSITLANNQLDAQILNRSITVLYMYMFRAISCSSSGGQIELTQHLVSSLTDSDDTRFCINTI